MISPHDRLGRHVMLTVALLIVVSVAVACSAASGGTKWNSRSVAESIKGLPFTPLVANSNVGRGPTRFALGLIQPDQTIVLQADVTARIFRLDNDAEKNPSTSKLLGTYTMTARTIDTADHGVAWRGPLDRDDTRHARANVVLRMPSSDQPVAPAHGGALQTIFTTTVDFPESGRWGAELQIKIADKKYERVLVTFAVLDKTSEPSVGDQVPRTKQAIATDANSLPGLDSSFPPHASLHNITVADAIASGKPTLVAFVSPAFCQTRFCGPTLNNVVIPMQQQFGSRVNAIHIEPYDLPKARAGTLLLSPAAEEWKLQSEPFLVVLDGQGRVTAKFEGIIDLDEVKQAIDAALAGK